MSTHSDAAQVYAAGLRHYARKLRVENDHLKVWAESAEAELAELREYIDKLEAHLRESAAYHRSFGNEKRARIVESLFRYAGERAMPALASKPGSC